MHDSKVGAISHLSVRPQLEVPVPLPGTTCVEMLPTSGSQLILHSNLKDKARAWEEVKKNQSSSLG